MIYNIVMAVVQAATEFLPVSSSGHLAILSNILDTPDMFLFVILHGASLLAVIIFLRKDILKMLRFDTEGNQILLCLIIATVPAAIFGILFKSSVEKSFGSFLVLSAAYLLTSVFLYGTKFFRGTYSLTYKYALIIGMFQVLALFPGISRSGITISTAMFLGIDREKAAKFSFLLFIPISAGALVLESVNTRFEISLIIPFFICFILSLFFMHLLFNLIRKSNFWIFSFYCLGLSVYCFFYFLRGGH